jgi:low affinity Fe/Cu permease
MFQKVDGRVRATAAPQRDTRGSSEGQGALGDRNRGDVEETRKILIRGRWIEGDEVRFSHSGTIQQAAPREISMKEWFRRLAARTSAAMGSVWAFLLALAATIVWLVTGPFYHFDVGWNFVANTTTTIITFLMVFLIQNTQSRDARAIHLKLDELLRGVEGARTSFVDIEELSDEDLAALVKEFQQLHDEAVRAGQHEVATVRAAQGLRQRIREHGKHRSRRRQAAPPEPAPRPPSREPAPSGPTTP